MGNMAARVIGVIAAVVSAIVNLAFISAYPVWSAIIIAIDVIVIYAIIVHGGDLKDAPTADGPSPDGSPHPRVRGPFALSAAPPAPAGSSAAG